MRKLKLQIDIHNKQTNTFFIENDNGGPVRHWVVLWEMRPQLKYLSKMIYISPKWLKSAKSIILLAGIQKSTHKSILMYYHLLPCHKKVVLINFS